MLSAYRVLDLSDERAHLTGHLLASLGADVIAVEPPEGSAARRLGPFVGDIRGPERSLTHFAYNRGKRSVVLDLHDATGQEQLRRLAAGADVLIESGEPGAMVGLGLGPEQLLELNPGLVYVSVSPFGQDGPKAHWAVTDLMVMAASGGLALSGDADRPPVRVSVPQGYHFGAVGAAGATLLALLERNRSGRGQHVDVAAQQVALLSTQAVALSSAVGAPVPTRSAGGAKVGDIELRFVYPTADDGYVSITHVFGPVVGPMTARLMAWVCDEGFCIPAMRDKDWINYELLLEAGDEPISKWEAAKAAVEAFTSSHTKAELLAGALERRVVMAPIATPKDVVESPQFAERGFFDKVEHREAGRYVLAPGAFVRSEAVPLRALGPAPKLGEHTAEVLAERPRRPAIAAKGPEATPATGSDLPLSGLKVLDFTWSIAGPHSVRVLADYGATVVKVETSHRLDGARGYRPCMGNIPGIENSTLFDDMSAGKLSLALDLNRPEGREVAVDLVRWADVVIESYSPRAMTSWGLAWDDLRQIRPDLVMVSTCLNGQTGPLANFAGFGNLAAALSGFYGLCGWPDRPPAGPFGAYTDYTATHLLLVAILAAVDHRRRTGQGLHLDMAQAEAAMHFLTPAILDWTVNGRITDRSGNRDPQMAPHGVYPAAGDDRWVAVACQDDAAWPALCKAMARDDLAARSELATAEGRLRRQDELDEAVSGWTATLPAAEVERRLQASGVAAHVVQSSAEIMADPQLWHRQHFVELQHPTRRCLVENSRMRLSRTPARVERCAPTLGQHTDQILTDILGYDQQRVGELRAAGVLE